MRHIAEGHSVSAVHSVQQSPAKAILSLSVRRQTSQHVIRHLFQVTGGRRHQVMRHLSIKRIPLGEQRFKFSARVCGLQEGAILVVSGAGKLNVNRGPQIDHTAALMEHIPVRWRHHNATPSRQHNTILASQLINSLLLATAKT